MFKNFNNKKINSDKKCNPVQTFKNLNKINNWKLYKMLMNVQKWIYLKHKIKKISIKIMKIQKVMMIQKVKI